jgi:uncharacterized protein DUF4388
VTSHTRQGSGHDWDDAKKAALFADIVSLKLSIDQAAALHGLRVDVIQEWLRQFRRSALVAFDERLKKTLIDQGANADALTAAEFTGHVEDVSIADLVQTIEIAGKDAVITVTHEGLDSRMWCSAGAIVDAVSGRLTGEAAVYRILSFERGRMVADLRPEQRTRTIYAATHRLLIESIRRKDASLELEKKLGNVNRFYRLGERSTSSRVRVSTDELSILRLFDGPRRLRDVLTQSHLGDLESLTALARLVDDGYLVELDTAPQSARASTEPKTQPSGAQPRIKTERLDPMAREELFNRMNAASRGEASIRLNPKVVTEAPSPSDALDRDSEARDGSDRDAKSKGPDSSSLESRGPDSRFMERRPDSSRPDAADVSSSATSTAPIAVTERPERATMPRWVLGAMAAALLAPAAFWFGETMSNLRAARRAHAAAESTVESRTAALDVSPTFSLATRVEPESAVIWLDRHPVATGRLRMVLPKDGSTHELRVAAPGHVPTTVFFADVPPPKKIALEPLPATPTPPVESPLAAGVAAGLAGIATTGVAAVAPPAPLGAAPVAARAAGTGDANAVTLAGPPPIGREPSALIERRSPPPSNAHERPELPTTARVVESKPPAQPQVQIIDEPAPRVRVIE